MNTEFTFDLIFSYWLDAWFIVWIIAHIMGINVPNPALFLAIGLSQNWWFLSRMFYRNIHTKWLYLGQSLLLKLLPLCFAIYLFPSRANAELKRSSIFGLCMVCIYVIYLWLNGTNPWKLYSEMNKSIISGETKTPFMKIAHALF